MKHLLIIMMVLLTITAFAGRKEVISELSNNIGISVPTYNKVMDGLTSYNFLFSIVSQLIIRVP